MMHAIERLIVPPLLKLIWLKEVKGMENIPKDGRFIVTPNHQSYLDDWIPPSLIVPYLDRELHMYVNSSYFKNHLSRWYLNLHKAIPIEVKKTKDHKKINQKAFKKALYYLKKKEPICIYPEGRRTEDGNLLKAKTGAAKLALEAKVPILPIGLIGTFGIWPKGKAFPKIKRIVKLKIGKPIYFDKYYRKQNNKAILNKITRVIMKEIAKLIGKEYKH